jgi:energy-coupling factor transporter transmembrane protein EcfT
MNAARKAIVILSAIFLVLLGLYEVVLGFPVAWWLYLAVTIMFTLSIVLTLTGRLPYRTLVIPFAAIAFGWLLFFVPWSSRKPFLTDLYSIRSGMNERQVREIMSGYIEGTGWPAVYGGETPGEGTLNDLGSGASYSTTSADGKLAIKDAIVFRHSNDGAYGSDWGIVTFENGRVVSVDFSPD